MDILNYLQALDEGLFEWVLLNLNPNWFAYACDLAVRNYNLIPVLGVFFFFYIKKDKNQAVFFLFCVFLLMAISEYGAAVLKEWIGRPRPVAFFDMDIDSQSLSFPSAHATNTMAQAVLWSYWFSGKRGLFYAIAFSIALARMMARYHFPGDILGGWLFGFLIGWIFVKGLKAVHVKLALR